MNAAIPPIRGNAEIMDGGCGCISGIDMNSKANPFDVILAIMSIAKHYYSDLHLIRQTANLSDLDIKDGLMENIRIIVVRLQTTSMYIRDITLSDLAEKFLFKNKQGSSGNSDTDVESDVNCFRSLLSVYLDEDDFTEKLYDGIDIVRALMRADDDDPQNDRRYKELNDITDEISEFELKIVEFNYARELFDSYYSMNDDNGMNWDSE